jgi:hypothetical protein
MKVEDTAYLSRCPRRFGQGRHLSIGQNGPGRNGPDNLQHPLLKKFSKGLFCFFSRKRWIGKK